MAPLILLCLGLALADEVEMTPRMVIERATPAKAAPLPVPPLAWTVADLGLRDRAVALFVGLVDDRGASALQGFRPTGGSWLSDDACAGIARMLSPHFRASTPETLCLQASVPGVGEAVIRLGDHNLEVYREGRDLASRSAAIGVRMHILEPVRLLALALAGGCGKPGGPDEGRCADLAQIVRDSENRIAHSPPRPGVP